jgi:thioester reductase-like protein
MIGASLIPRLLRRFPSSTITLLVRANDEEDLASRLDAIRRTIERDDHVEHLRERLHGVRGDILDENLGLPAQMHDRLARETTHIIHGAATIRFDHPLEEARLINCGGTARMLALARLGAKTGALSRFVYIGTSSVSGRRHGHIYERELEMGQAFFNTYEQSKCESERLVRDAMGDIPAVIFRPSIVIGDSRTGRTSSFNVIYIPLRLLERGLLNFVPGTPDTTLDLVPVDWVNEVMAWCLGRDDAPGKVCHVTAGPGRAARLGDVVRHAKEYFDTHAHHRTPRTVEFITREDFNRRRAAARGREEALMAQLDTLLPYVTVDRLFDSVTTDSLLEGSGIAFPRYAEYADRILGYCLRTKWGKNPDDRAG